MRERGAEAATTQTAAWAPKIRRGAPAGAPPVTLAAWRAGVCALREACVLDARRRLRHARRARLRMVRRARRARRGPTRNGAKPRPRPRESAEGQPLGHGAQAPASEKADEIARDPGGHSARGGGAVAELKRSS